MGNVPDRLWSEISSYVAAEHLELDDLEVLGEGSGRIIRVTLDDPTAGATIDVGRIADLSRGLSRVLDVLDPFEGRPYSWLQVAGSTANAILVAGIAGGATLAAWRSAR